MSMKFIKPEKLLLAIHPEYRGPEAHDGKCAKYCKPVLLNITRTRSF